MSTIVDVVVADKNLSTMLRGVKAAGLETELSKTGPFTVFAPSEMAFGKLAQGQLTDLLKPENKIELTGLLQQHVVEGKTNFKDFTDGQKLKTLSGKELLVKVINGTVTINGARIQGRDHDASNGVVHSLDAVIAAN
ncbi:MAG TPA: fasciclin domain-containing protein [Chitinophagaceae bacterium]|nr:fasciclin domain-containing protein [Chitinophagaceae bacterium]